MEVSKQVVWIWSVVCAERGRGMDICLGEDVGAIAVAINGCLIANDVART